MASIAATVLVWHCLSAADHNPIREDIDAFAWVIFIRLLPLIWVRYKLINVRKKNGEEKCLGVSCSEWKRWQVNWRNGHCHCG
ncbi:hypothetical protein AVEN_11033-1 [Araneus ventricosus]|uniref:Uncharacterized protein n=1 Tax=Araneus ventricosus TaxID=182803 RepID=A0A4Y2JSZ1_ARAVE|nr:hypothetical protein AVEN_11033-1 [Araneus ventricosus]